MATKTRHQHRNDLWTGVVYPLESAVSRMCNWLDHRQLDHNCKTLYTIFLEESGYLSILEVVVHCIRDIPLEHTIFVMCAYLITVIDSFSP